MILTRALIDLWDPEFNIRHRSHITIIQILQIPIVVIGCIFTLPFDLLTLPWQIRIIHNGSD
jgi:hypothetical protein